MRGTIRQMDTINIKKEINNLRQIFNPVGLYDEFRFEVVSSLYDSLCKEDKDKLHNYILTTFEVAGYETGEEHLSFLVQVEKGLRELGYGKKLGEMIRERYERFRKEDLMEGCD